MTHSGKFRSAENKEDFMRKSKALALTMLFSLGCLAVAACTGKSEEYTVMGAKDWNIKASESTYD